MLHMYLNMSKSKKLKLEFAAVAASSEALVDDIHSVKTSSVQLKPGS